jgi:O-antigen ligase
MESEPGQIWMETGPLGFLSWFGIRAILILTLFSAYRQARTPFQRSMALLAATISIIYLIAQIAGNHTGNILIHALIGLALVPLLESTIPLPRTTTRNLTPSLPPPNPRSSRVPRPIRSHNSPRP